MSEPAPRRWSVQDFSTWQEPQDERDEVVGGVSVRLMAGARNVHDDIVVNRVAEFGTRLRRTPFRPVIGNGSVETRPGRIRLPDLGVEGGSRDPDGLTAAEPRLIAEVLSPSTGEFDAFDRVEEYKTVASLAVIPLVEPNAPEIVLCRRQADGSWLDPAIDLPELGMSLALADIDDGAASQARSRLITGA